MLSPLTPIKGIPLSGGAVTSREKAILPFASFSDMKNMRNEHPGLKQRKGCIKLHTTADGTNQALSTYMFSKSKISSDQFFAQMSDGDILEATNLPPTVTTGAFGSEIFDGSASQIPASWGDIDDLMLHSNGADQHQIYSGSGNYVDKFIVFKGTAAPPDIPQDGEDYSNEVSDGLTTTVAVLDSLNTYANNHCLFFKTAVPAKSITITIAAANGNASTMTLYYRKNDNTFANVAITDNTDSGGDTLAVTGSVTWTPPSDMIPKYMFGDHGYWYQLRFSAQLDAEVEISSITYAADFQDIENVWNGIMVYAIEAQVEGTTQWYTYASVSVDLDTLAIGKKIVLAFTDPVEAIYWDVGSTPNATGTALTSLKYWDGNSFESVGSITDETNGLSQSGWMTFPRKAAQPHQFEGTQYYAYWYEVIFDAELAADVSVTVLGMPYFELTDFGNKGYCNTIWKDRALYAFDLYGSYIYVTAVNQPLVLNGSDYGILQAGDGRSNRVVAMRRFHNEVMVWQQEQGVDGGCVTLFEGYSPTTFGKLLLSSRIGAMNNKCVTIVDGVLTATRTEEVLKTLAFWVSRYGICVSDGRTISIISDDIQNYFDPTKSECIRYGYESEMWLEYDAAYNVIRVGLVSGTSATKPNVFPVFDLITKTWSFDTPAQELSCMVNAEAGSGNIPVIQVGGGIDDGFIYLLNSGTNDVSTAINASITMELGYSGEIISLDELLLRIKAQAAGDLTLKIYENDILQSTLTLSMLVELASQTYRRHRQNINQQGQLISLELYNSTASQEVYLIEIGVKTSLWENI